MDRDKQLGAIRAACIKANPEIREVCANCQERLESGKHKYGPTRIGKIGCSEKHIHCRPIRLADVLLAHSLMISPPKDMAEKAEIQNEVLNIIYWWNLRQDDLTLQSDECISFLAQLLA